MPTPQLKTPSIVAGLLAAILAVSAGWGWYQYWQTAKTLRSEQTAVAKITNEKKDLNFKIEQLLAESQRLTDELKIERGKNSEFEEQIAGITDVVGDLEKLSQTDPELLQKYSRVYFLNENYIPPVLVPIGEQYLYDRDKPLEIHAEVAGYLEDLLADAADDDVNLSVVSAYRSFNSQSSLKSQYLVSYGSGANKFSADQGYSEHQLGTAVDFTSSEIQAIFTGFDKTKSYEWLKGNAYKYGFILSYPVDNGYYQFEPWHWRFVGQKLARYLHNKELYFYNLDQREIDKYLINIFD